MVSDKPKTPFRGPWRFDENREKRRGLLDTRQISSSYLRADLKRTNKEYMNWLFDEFEIQFFDLENATKKEVEEKALEYAKYFLRMLKDADIYQEKASNFMLNLLSLHFPKVREFLHHKES